MCTSFLEIRFENSFFFLNIFKMPTLRSFSTSAPYLLLLLSLISNLAFAIQISVPSYGDECFYEKAEQNNKMAGSFEVVSGGMFDVDCDVKGPNGRSHYSATKQKQGVFTFLAPSAGTYSICFSNRMSSQAEKTVVFSLHTGDAFFKDVAKQEHITPLESEITELSDAINKVEDEQQYMNARERASREMNESTNRRVLWFSILEAVVVVALGWWQISYLRQSFEKKGKF